MNNNKKESENQPSFQTPTEDFEQKSNINEQIQRLSDMNRVADGRFWALESQQCLKIEIKVAI